MNKGRLSDVTAKRIRNMIEESRFKVGDKLPNENDFANELGISRSTLREEIKELHPLLVLHV